MVVVDATSGGSGGNFCSGTGTQLVVVVIDATSGGSGGNFCSGTGTQLVLGRN